jgi:hypothetical protein
MEPLITFRSESMQIECGGDASRSTLASFRIDATDALYGIAPTLYRPASETSTVKEREAHRASEDSDLPRLAQTIQGATIEELREILLHASTQTGDTKYIRLAKRITCDEVYAVAVSQVAIAGAGAK